MAEFPDISTLRVSGRVEEAERGRVKEGQPVTVRIDAVPDKEFPAHVVEISALAKIDFSGWPFPRNFDVAAQLDQSDVRVRPGMSATARVAVEKLPDSILVPPEATFQKFGKTVAYVLSGSSFQERDILVAKRSESHVVVARGLKPGERVALKDPTASQKQ
jgi:HlyD family secretion protein